MIIMAQRVRREIQASMNARVLIRSMRGLGDTIYQRPFIRTLAEDRDVYLRNPWIELFQDVPRIRFMRYRERLRTQDKNLRRNLHRTRSVVPVNTPVIRVVYGISNPYRGIIPDYETVFGVPFRPELFDLPMMGACPVSARKPIAVIRPVTVRNEWANPARNCKPEYIHEAIGILRERFHVVSVADVVPNGEWFDGAEPQADQCFHRGELRVQALMALIQHAAVIVGSVGWIAPAAAAAKRPAVLIGGGQGAWNAPGLVFPPQVDTRRIRWVVPDNYCRCAPADHDCDKTITDFAGRFRAALQEIT